MFKIVLDAGHGLYTPGKRTLASLDSKETREWVLNDRICDRVERLLRKYEGYSIIRVDDTTGQVDVPLAERVKRANEAGVDFYLSVHHNAGVNGGSGGGIISVAHTNATSQSLEYQKILYDELIATTKLSGNRSTPLARQNLYVLRETRMPAVLVECGFMDSTTDVPHILSEEFANKAAEGIVNALVRIGNLRKKEEKKMGKFTDISGNFAEKSINELYQMGVVNGVTETEFAPEKCTTRAELAVISRNIIRYITGE